MTRTDPDLSLSPGAGQRPYWAYTAHRKRFELKFEEANSTIDTELAGCRSGQQLQQ